MLIKINFLYECIYYYRWLRYQKLLQNKTKSITELIKLGSNVFSKYNKPNTTIIDINTLYCKMSFYCLHKMLSEVDRSVTEYKQYGCIYNDKNFNKPEIIRLDQWVYEEGNFNLFDSYEYISKQLITLIELAEKNNHITHIERRCFKIFHTYITIVEILGELKYQRK